MPAGITTSSSRSVPPLTSPTSNATWPPDFSTRRTSERVAATNACHSPTSRASVTGTVSASMPQNQHRRRVRRHPPQQRSALAQNDGLHVAARRLLSESSVDLELRSDRDRLVRG